MTLRPTSRALRASVFTVVCLSLVAAPAGAAAKTQKHPKKKTEAAKVRFVPASSAPATGLGNTTGLNPTTQLTAMNTALAAAPGYFAGRDTGCQSITAMLTSVSNNALAGNFRDAFGGCYVWLNLQQSRALTGSEICKTTLHEYGHLSGLSHSPDTSDVMYAPFRSDPIPGPCQSKGARS